MAMIVDALANQFAEALATMAKEEVTMMLNVKGDLRRLERRMVFIRSVLEDAESKALGNTTNANAIRVWLADLKDVLYDAVDVIDLRRTRVEQLKRLSSNRRSVPCYSCLLSFSLCVPRMVSRCQTGHKIRSINGRLEGIIKDQSDFGLIAAATARDDHGRISSSMIHRQTGSVLEPDIVGMQIENDTSHLVDLLMTEYRVPAPAVSVLAIVGMGGIGKTTLAQKVFNHPTIKNNFRPMWVCVSQDYSATDVLKKVIRGAGGDPNGAQFFSELEQLLEEVIEQQKFLLILDDVWSARVWDEILRKPLQRAAAGSRILITTRDANVAKLMGAVYCHTSQTLSEKDGWLLLSKKVLQGGVEGGLEAVKYIGVQIVKKCQGLPLAINTIAGVLMVKDRTPSEWQRVLDNPVWSLTELPGGGGVMGALYLSYQDLPSHLKQCFVFCSSFPEDYQIKKDILIQYWIAHGFVEAGEVAEDCYKELLSRSLLQPIYDLRIMHDLHYDYDDKCTMHDLLRTLAQFLATGDMEGWSVKASASAKIRHLYLIDHNNQLNSVPDHESLRTLHLESGSFVDFAPRVFKKLRHLRVFKLECKNVERLPDTVQNLILLRVLDLSKTSITELPESIGSLSNLQKLDLSDTKITELPESIGSLSNLQMLDLCQTGITKLPESIGSLSNLQKLILHGTSITELPESIGSLSNLQRLYLSLTNITELPESIGSLSNLQMLKLFETPITELPESIGSLSNLQLLDLSKTPITELPESIGSLRNLQMLQLSETDITEQPESIASLSNLQILMLDRTSITELPESIGSLSNLQTLDLSLTKITELPESIGSLSNLQMLDLPVTNITELPENIGSLSNLKFLHLSLTKITKLPESIGSLSNLQMLNLHGTKITELPESIGSLSNLQMLDLSGTSITELPESIGSLSNLQMQLGSAQPS